MLNTDPNREGWKKVAGASARESATTTRTAARAHIGAKWRWDGTLGFFLGACLMVVAGGASAQAIRPDGRTQTTVTTTGAVTDVRTATVSGANAFNSFLSFSVPTSRTANLYLPAGTANLINIVRDERTNIDGILNAIKDGRIGGNVWFANPHGFIVGNGGVVNIGSLNVSTPSQAFADNFFLSPGSPDEGSVTQLLNGTAPRNPAGLISIQGRVNAIDGINLSAGVINVGGTLFAGARFLGTAPDFTDVVNANGIASATNIIAKAGRIMIVADGDVAVGGTLAAPGAAGVRGGDIDVRAGGNIDVQSGALVTARGNGLNSGGGTIYMMAENNAVNRAGSLLDASAGLSGNGGAVEFSAKNNIELAGGELRADGTGGGLGGTLLVDPSSITVSADILRGASGYAGLPSGGSQSGTNNADLTLIADDSITINSNVVISSRAVASPSSSSAHVGGASTGNSGNITLEAPSIVLNSGSKVLAQADGAYTGGTVTLTADKHNTTNFAGFRDASATIEIDGATVRANVVNMNASTNVETKWYYTSTNPLSNPSAFADTMALGATTFATDAGPAFALSLLGINVVHSQSTGSSSVIVKGGSLIEGKQSVSLTAQNSTTAGAMTSAAATPGAQVATPLGLGALYSHVRADATVDIQSGATIKGGDLKMLAHNDASLEGKIKGGSDSSSSNTLSIAFGVTMANVNATATIQQGAVIKSTGDISVAATNYNRFENKVEAVTGPNGKIAAAVAYSEHHTNATAKILSDVADARNVQVVAVDHGVNNATEASTSTGVTEVDQITNQAKQLTLTGIEEAIWSRFGLAVQTIDPKATPQATPFRIGGAISYVNSNHSATALIGANARVHATGSVAVVARTIDESIKISAESAVSSSSANAPGGSTGASGSPSRVNVSMGLAIGSYDHDASASIGADAVVTAQKIGVASDTSIPIRPSILVAGSGAYGFDRWDGLSTFKEAADSLNFLDIVNGVSSSKVKGSDSEGSIGFSGSANLIGFTNNSRAVVEKGATLNLTGTATGSWSLPDFTLRDATSDLTVGGVLLFRGDPADVQQWRFDAPAQVRATHDATLIFQAGKTIGLADSASQKAIGMGLNQVDVGSTVEAIVREGVLIRGLTETASAADADGVRTYSAPVAKATDEVRVTASSSDQIISFGANAGKAGGGGNAIGINGTISIVNIDNNTLASVDNEATITTRKLAVTGAENVVAWSIAGGFNLSSSTAVGIGLAYNDVTTDTRAEIADNDTHSTTGSARSSLLNVTGAAVNARQVDVEGRTGGRVEAIAITGAVSNSGNPANPPGAFDKVKASYDAAVSKIGGVVGLGGSGSASQQSSEAKPPPTPPTSGLSGAGSGAINVTEMTTKATVDGATLNMAPAGTTGTPALTVRAVSDSDITTASGAAAITRANNPSQTSSAAMDGSVALNMIGNGTEALVRNSAVTGVHNVDVQALTGGEQLSVAIGAAVDASTNTNINSSKSVTGSLSLTLAQVDANGDTENYAKARIVNSTITGDSTTAGGNANVTAYNHTMIGTGGGALMIGGKTGVGGAVTYSDIRNDVIAQVSGSTISQFDTVSVHATNATEIGAGAATGGVSTRNDGSAIGGAIVLTSITNKTSALIDSLSSVTARIKVEVLAQDAAPLSTLEALIDPGNERTNVVTGLDYCGRQAGIGAAASGNCITSVAGVVQLNGGSNSSNLGISYTQSLINNSLTARIQDSAITATDASGVVSARALSSANILGLALGVGAASKFSGAGSVSVGQIDNTITAAVTAPLGNSARRTLTANNITIQAKDDSTIQTVGGQVVISSKQNAIGAAVTYNDISNESHALADGVALNAPNQISIDSQNNSTIRSLAVAGGLAGSAAVTASASINFIGNTTDAKVNNSTLADGVAGGSNAVSITALDASTIESLAGSVAIGKTAGVGAAFAFNQIRNSNLVSVNGSTIDSALTLTMLARENATIRSLSVGVAGGGSYAGGASISLNMIGHAASGGDPDDTGHKTVAEFKNSTLDNGTTAASVMAKDDSQIHSMAGNVAISLGSAAVGGAVADNSIYSVAKSTVSGATLHDVAALTVQGDNASLIESLSAAGAGAAGGSFAGSASSNRIGNRTLGELASSEITGTTASVAVRSIDAATIKSLAGGVAVAFGSAAGGAAVAVNKIDSTTRADVSGSPGGTRYSVSDLLVSAKSADTITTMSVGVGVGASVGVGGSVAVNLLNSSTQAYIDGGARVEAEDNVGVIAQTDDKIKLAGGAGGVGLSAAGVGASVTVNQIGGTTSAYISGASTEVAARAKDTAHVLTVADGSLTSPVDLQAGLSLGAYTGPADLAAKRRTESVTGIAVNASATHSIETQARNIAGGTYAGVAGTTNVNTVGGSTTAYIDAARINGGDNSLATAQQAVHVKASDHAYAADFIGSISGGAAGIGLAVDTSVFNRTTKAYVQSSTIDARGEAEVMANSTQGVSSFVVGGSAGVVGVVGTGTVTKFTSLTEAYASGATLNAGTLSVDTGHASRMFNADGALSLGASVGVAGTFAVGLDASTTKAHIDGGTANVTGLIAVDARSSTEMHNWAISGAGAGGTAVAGMAVVALIGNTTQAYVSGNAAIGSATTSAGSLRVSAFDSTTVDNNAGAGAAGLTAGVGAGASVTKVDNTVSAYIDNSNVYTTNDIAVTAQAERNLSTTAVTLGLGLTTGISGAVAVTTVGAALGSDAGGELGSGSSGTLASVDSFSGGNRLDTSGSGNVTTSSLFTQSDVNAANSAGTVATAAGVAPAQFNQKTSASISGTSKTIRAGGGISVTASEKDKIATTVGSGAGGAVAVGAAVGVTNVTNNVEAKISGSLSLTSTGGSVLVSAATGNLDPGRKGAEVKAYQGSGGLAAVNASVATISMVNNVNASIGRGISTTVSGAGNLSVSATDTASVNAEARAYTVGLGAAGAAVAASSKSGTALATIGDVAASGAATSVSMGTGSLIIASNHSGSVDAYTQAGSGGAYSGSGSAATATDSSATTARIGNAVTVTGSANIAVQASAQPDVGAVAEGYSVGLSGGVGASVALATASPVTTAFVGDGAQLAGNSLLVSAENALSGNNDSAYAKAVGGSGGVLFGINATIATASSQEQAIAYTGSNVKLTDGSVTVRARNTSRQKSLGTGVAVGGLAAGATVASAASTGTTTARLGSGTTTSANRAGDLTVSANSDDGNDASAIAGSGGVVAGNGASATTTDTATTTATIDGGTIRASTVLVDAKHTDNYAAKTDSVNAAVAGGSGAVSSNTGNATTLANVAGAVALTAQRTVDITAKNVFNSTTSGSSATAAAGGVINGSAAISSTTLTGSSQVTLGNGAAITSGTDPVVNPGGIRAVASSELNHGDTVTLATGGLIQGAGTDSTLNATFGNTVTIGTGNQLRSQGSIGAGTFTKADANTSSLVSTWGAAAVGSAGATTNVTSNQSVVVNGGGTLIEAFGNVDLTTGRDPNGSRDTTLDGGSSAQAYVRGLIAVPAANASTNLTSNASLSIASGAQVKSGQNVTIGAYHGTLDPTADGTGHGYELGFIPVTNGTSHTSAPTTASVTQNGAVSAGIYRNLTINSSGNTLVADAGGAPFVYAYTPNFDIQGFIAQNYEGTQATLLASGVATGNVGAFSVGTLFAAGGTVTVNADTLAGSGSLTSYGAPKITLINSSPNYLILGPALIPNTPGAKIIFTGAAGRAQAGSIVLDESGAGQSPVISIRNTYAGAVGTSAGNYGPAVVLTGTVENLGGLVSIYNANGSLGQLDTIYGQQVTLDIPNGVAVINVQGTRPYYAGGNPYSEWENYMIWPGGNPASGAPNANLAVTYVANSMFNSGGTYTTTAALTQKIIGDQATMTGSWMFFGGCYPYGCDVGTANSLSPVGSNFQLTSGHSVPFIYPAIPVQTLTKSASSYASANLTGSQNSRAVYGGQVSIKAQYIDMNGKIVAGQPTNHSIGLPAALTAPVVLGPVFDHYEVAFVGGLPQIVPIYRTDVVAGGAISLFEYYYGKGQITNPEFEIPASVTRAGDSLMGATYNAQTRTITIKDVSASSGGGYVKLEGGILGSNTLGQIHVNGGLGDVDINNQTSLAMSLNKVNAGNAALAQGLSSKVEIIDTMRSSSANHWLYEYVPGQGITLYTGAQTATLGQGSAGNSTITPLGGSATSFAPVNGLRWNWAEKATLSRTIPIDGSGFIQTPTNWTWDNVVLNNPWKYLDSSGNVTSTPTTPSGWLTTQSGLPVFQQTVSGSSTNTLFYSYGFGGCDAGPAGAGCNYGFRATGLNGGNPNIWRGYWAYNYPRAVQLTRSTSVKADNPVTIDFSGNSRGAVAINSNAAVSINGQVINPNGNTNITASTGSITETTTGGLLSNNLTLNAGAGIGAQGSALKATLTSNGLLNAQGGNTGVFLNINSAATVGKVASGSAAVGYGDVVLNADNDLLAGTVASGTANVTGRNITIKSNLGSVGSETAPLILASKPTALTSGATSGGVVNVSALNNIGLTHIGGDLLIGSIASTAGGDVYLNVPNGTILGAAGQTAAQALDPDQVRKVWQDLKLTTAYGAEQPGDANARSVVNFQTQVNATYRNFWRLRANGTVSGGTLALNSTGLALYRPLAAAALGTANPSDAQVQTFANGQYQNALTYLNTSLGSGWTNSANGLSYNAGFNYVATTAQVNNLTQNAVWSENELSYAINRTALQPSAGAVGVGTPYISGRDIKLVTQGAIGKLAAPVSITLADLQAGNLTVGQKAALALAIAPGDVLAVDASGNPVGTGVTPHAFQIQQTAPVFLDAAGKLTTTSGGVTFVQSTGQNLSIGHVQSGGNVSIAAPQSILVAAGAPAKQIDATGDLTLLAGSGSIGTSAAPITYQISGNLLSASATQNTYLAALGGNMTIGRVFAGNTASLNAPDGSILSYLGGLVIQGDSVSLTARDDIGSSSRALQAEVGASGLFGGSAGGRAWILSPDTVAPLNVGTLSASGGMNLTSNADLNAQLLRSSAGAIVAAAGADANIAAINSGISTAASGAITVTAVGDLTVGAAATTPGAITLQAGGLAKVTGLVSSGAGNIAVSGDTIDVAAGGSLVSATGTIGLQATGDIFIDKVQTGNATASAIAITSTAGRVLEASSDAAADIIANSANAVVTITAPGGIGNGTRIGTTSGYTATPNALETQIAALGATSTGTGAGIHLSEADALAISSVAANGTLVLTAGGALSGTLAQSTASSVSVAGGSVNLTTVSGATTATVTSTSGTVQLGSASAGGLLTVQGQTGVTATSLTTSGTGSIAVTAITGDLTATTIDAVGAVTLASNATAGDIKVDTVEGQDAVSVTAGRSILGRNQAGYVRIESLGGNTTLNAQNGSITGTTTKALGNVSMTGKTGIDATTTTATNGTLGMSSSAGALVIGTANAQGQMTLQGQTGIVAGTLTTDAGSIAATAVTGDLALTTTDAADAVTLTATTGNVKVDTVEAQNNILVTAGTSILGKAQPRYGRIESLAGNVTLNAQGGGITGDVTSAAGNVQMAASNNIDTSITYAAAGDVTMTAGANVTAAWTTATTGSVTMTGGTNVTAGLTTGGTNVTMTAQDGDINATSATASLGNVVMTASSDVVAQVTSAGMDILMTATAGSVEATVMATAGRDVNLTAGTDVTSWMVTGARNVNIAAQGGDISAFETAATNGNVAMTASSDVAARTTTAGTDISIAATTGNVGVTNSATAGQDVFLTAGTDITSATVTGARKVTMGASNNINATTTTATTGNVSMTGGANVTAAATGAGTNVTMIAQGGDINATATTANSGNVAMTASSDVTAATAGAGIDISMTATTGNVGVTTSAMAGRDVILIADTDITTATVTGARNVTMTAGGAMNATTTTAQNGTLTATTNTGLMTLGTANSEGQMTLTGQTGIVAGTLTTDAGSINATAVTGDLALSTTDAANAVTLTATANNVKVDVVEAQNGVSITAGQAIGGKPTGRYTRVESLGGNVTMGAGTDIVGDLSRASNNVQMTAGQGIDANTVTATGGSVTGTATAADLKIGASSAGTTTSLTATAGNARVTTVQGAGQVSISAAQTIEGLTAGTRATTIRSAGANVVLGAANINTDTVEAKTNVQMTAGQTIDAMSTTALDGTLTATTTTGLMTLGTANAQGQMTLQGQTGIVAGTLTTDAGSINATAATGDLSLTTTDSANAVTLTAIAGNAKVDTVEAQSNITVTAGQSIDGKSGARYASIESLAGNVTLNARGGDVVGDLTRAASNVQMIASSNIDATTTTATAGSVTLTGGANVSAVTTTADQNIAMSATLGDVTATTAIATNGTLGLTAGQDVIVLTNATSGGNMTLTGQRDLKMLSPAALQSRGANITGNAVTGDVDVNAATAFGSITFTAGGNVRFGTASAGQNVSFTATAGDVNATTTTAGGNLGVVAGNDIVLGSATTGGNQTLRAGSDLTAGTLTSTGGSITGTATAGNVDLGTATAQVNATFRAGDGLTAHTIIARTGDATVRTNNDITVDTIKAGNDALLDTLNGSMNVTHIVGDGVLLLAKLAIVAPDLKVGRRLVLTSDSVNAGITHTRADSYLQATLIGRNNPVMSSVVLTMDSQIGIDFLRFWAQNADVNMLTGVLQLSDAYIGNRMLANNPMTSVLMDNATPFLQTPYDAQLYSATKSFFMILNGSLVMVRGTDIIHREMLNHTVLSETTGLDSSATETSVEEVFKAGRIVLPGLGVLLQPSGELVRFTGSPVMLQGPEPRQPDDDEPLQ